jgi:hypothetical protein
MQSLGIYFNVHSVLDTNFALKLNYKKSFIFGVGDLFTPARKLRDWLARRFSAILKLPDFLHANLDDFQLSSYEDFLSIFFISNLLIFPNVRESITLVILCLPHICVTAGNYTGVNQILCNKKSYGLL